MLTTYKICTINIAGICLARHQGSKIVPVNIMLRITNDCTTIIAPDINFGSAPLVREFSTISQSLSVICTKGSSYTIGLSNGNYGANSQRYMANGKHLLAYDIYKADSMNRWGPTGHDRVSSTAANSISSDGLIRKYNYTARISAGQNTPPAGNYKDSVVVDLAF